MTERERLVELIIKSVDGCARHWAEVIADYLLQNGVIVSPCNVGDDVFQTDGIKIYKSTVKNIIFETPIIAFDKTAIGKSIFLSFEEAEKALKEMNK